MLLVYAHEGPSCCDDNADQHAKPKAGTPLEDAEQPRLQLREETFRHRTLWRISNILVGEHAMTQSLRQRVSESETVRDCG